MLQERYESALEDYCTSIKLNPRHCRAHFNRAYVYDKLDRHDEAIADYDTAIGLVRSMHLE